MQAGRVPSSLVEIGDLLYAAYERRVSKSLQDRQTPRHVGVILDGNRRFAKARGAGTEEGHRAGAENIGNFLGWCEDTDVEVVTLWLLSTDNLTRPPQELDKLLRIIEGLVADLATAQRWQLHAAGALDMLPVQTAAALRRAATAHGEHEKRIGHNDPEGWPDWYADYMVREQAGKELPK